MLGLRVRSVASQSACSVVPPLLGLSEDAELGLQLHDPLAHRGVVSGHRRDQRQATGDLGKLVGLVGLRHGTI